jgi:hypothetical protein
VKIALVYSFFTTRQRIIAVDGATWRCVEIE